MPSIKPWFLNMHSNEPISSVLKELSTQVLTLKIFAVMENQRTMARKSALTEISLSVADACDYIINSIPQKMKKTIKSTVDSAILLTAVITPILYIASNQDRTFLCSE